MSFEIFLLLGIVAAALVLFTWEPWPADVVALGLMLALILTGLLPADEAFRGFGSETVLLILGLLILTGALTRTGVMDLAGRAILRRAGDNPNRLLLTIMATASGLSAFMSNTAATALFVPIVLGIARRTGTSPSRLLMPLAFASILSSPITLIGSSTNIVISGLIAQAGMPPLGMFELTPLGIPITVVGILYMYWIGHRLIPARINPDELEDTYTLRHYFTEVVILPGSRLIGQSMAEAGLSKELGLTVIQVYRAGKAFRGRMNDYQIEEGDALLVGAKREELIKIKDTAGIDLKTDVKFVHPEPDAQPEDLAEVILLPRSPLIGRTLEGIRFKDRYNVHVVGINRGKSTILDKISQTPLRSGDLLLIQGQRARLIALEDQHYFRLIGEVIENRPNIRQAPLAIGIFVAVLLAATFNILSLPVAVLLGTLIAFLIRTISPQDAYREVEWKVLIMIGSMLSLGAAMQSTGAAQYFAGQIVGAVGQSNPLWILTGFFVLTLLLTQPMSNQAAAIVVVPIAIQTANQLGLNPRTFAAMIAVAASCSFLTPLEPSCMMVYSPGRYRFMDFVKVGSLLTLLIFLLSILLVPIVWPLH